MVHLMRGQPCLQYVRTEDCGKQDVARPLEHTISAGLYGLDDAEGQLKKWITYTTLDMTDSMLG